MNKRMEEEMEEPIITKHGRKWRLIKKLRRDFAAARPSTQGSLLVNKEDH